MTSRHQQLFLGNCYTCNNFGHIARNCKLNAPMEKGITSHTSICKKNTTKNNLKGRNYNSFAPLQSYSTECYKCGNQGHIARNSKLVTPMENHTTKYQGNQERKVWKKKDDLECSIALCATTTKNLWHVDSGCSKHITGDQNKFISLKEIKKEKSLLEIIYLLK